MPNVELLTKTLTHIETHPGQWKQGSWRTECGTAYCFAGWAIVLAGGSFVTHRVGFEYKVVPPGVDPNDNKQWRNVDDLAAELLGIPNTCGDVCGGCPGDDGDCMAPLFEANNTLDDLRRIVAEHIAEATR